MTKFEKVSLARYQKDRAEILLREGMSLEEAYQVAEQEYEKIELPRRGTLYSAGYDIRTPAAYRVEPGQNLVIPTGLRIAMEEDMWLGIYIRSSLGFKYQVRLSNSVTVIDADYYGADNEGHLRISLYNGGDRPLALAAGDAFAQGILQKYYKTDDDEPVQKVRKGGIGSTNHS